MTQLKQKIWDFPSQFLHSARDYTNDIRVGRSPDGSAAACKFSRLSEHCSMLGKNSKISFFAATESLCWYVSLNPGNLRTSGFLHSAKLF